MPPDETPEPAAATSGHTDPGGGQPPNIVFIFADDMGYGDLSSLNPDSKIPTPNIDRITHEGTHFTDAHSPSALCTPSRYGTLTGRYCWRTRIKSGVTWGFSRHLIDQERLTVPSLLKRHGYNTACVGKWHLGMDMPAPDGGAIEGSDEEIDQRSFIADVDWTGTIENGPLSLGFDYFYGMSASLDMYPYIWIEDDHFVGEGASELDLLYIHAGRKIARYGDNTGPAHPDFVPEEVMPTITRKTVEYIESQSSDAPFFMYMPLTAPHIPLVPSESFQGRSEIGPYGDFCIEVDDAVGQVLDALERKGLADNTLVIFTADNGCAPYIGVEAMNDLGHYPSYVYRGYKADIYEGGHRIPFVARWPGRIEPGASSDQIVCLTDLLATCASILGEELPNDAGEDSYDILPALTGEPIAGSIREATVYQAGDGSFAVRQGRWKLENTPSSGGYGGISAEEAEARNLPPIQLYDLESDVGEQTNVYADHPEVIDSLNALLERYHREGRSTPVR